MKTVGPQGTFILSLDCEGKWGMADHLDHDHDTLLTSAALGRAYETLASMLDRFDIAATFAFVMGFLLEKDELGDFDDLLLGARDRPDSWLERYRHARAAGNLEGWHLPQALDIAKASGLHEIGCHGFCHRPLGAAAISAEGARHELAAAMRVAEIRGVKLCTLVFPRNDVGHLDEVRNAGFTGYRTRLARPSGLAGRAVRIAEEFNLWAEPQRSADAEQGLVPIPPGYFFNWRRGMRRFVPAGITRRRWDSLLRRSAEDGGIVHLWLHPHNLITAPDTAASLERVLADVAEMRASGDIRVMTQEQYCRELLASGPAESRSGVRPLKAEPVRLG